MTQPVQKSADEKYCHECGEIIRAKAEICPKCGVRQSPVPGTFVVGSRNKTVAAVLALLLGWIGVHKFYLGRTGQGILYIAFCWTFIPAIIAFIEAILLLTMSEEKFAAEYSAA